MFILFLIIHLVLAAVFYFFAGISGRYYESIYFIVSGFLFFFYFSPFYVIGSKEKATEKQTKFLSFLSKEKLKNIIPNSRKLLYSGAVILFYLSIYGIFYSYALEFDYFIVSIASFLLLLIIASKQYFPKEIIFLAYRTNTLFFSIYVFIKTLVLIIQPGEITWLFIIENILFLLSGIIILFWDSYISEKFKNSIYLFYLGYLLVSLLFYIQTFILDNIHTTIILLGTTLSVVFFEYLPKIKQLKIYEVTSKYFGLFLSYITLLYIGILISIVRPYFSFDIIGLFLLGSAFQYYIHKKFENYLSYLFVIGVIIMVYAKTFLLYETLSFFFYLLFTMVLPGAAVLYTFFVKNTHQYDYYILYISMILFSIGGIITYFYYFPFSVESILPASVFLLLESALFFVSFVRLKK